MARYERDFMGRVRGMWDRFTGETPRGGASRYGHDYRYGGGSRQPMEATGPGGEGYFLSRDMANQADATMDYSDRGWDDMGDRGFMPGDIAQFGRAGRGRGYSGDYDTGRGGRDAGEFFVNRQGGDTGYRGGYQRDLGMQGRGSYGGDYTYGGFARGYDRRYRGGGHLDRGPRYGNDYRDMGPGLQSYYSGTAHEGGVIGQTSSRGGMVPPAGREHEGTGRNRTPFPRTYGR